MKQEKKHRLLANKTNNISKFIFTNDSSCSISNIISKQKIILKSNLCNKKETMSKYTIRYCQCKKLITSVYYLAIKQL